MDTWWQHTIKINVVYVASYKSFKKQVLEAWEWNSSFIRLPPLSPCLTTWERNGSSSISILSWAQTVAIQNIWSHNVSGWLENTKKDAQNVIRFRYPFPDPASCLQQMLLCFQLRPLGDWADLNPCSAVSHAKTWGRCLLSPPLLFPLPTQPVLQGYWKEKYMREPQCPCHSSKKGQN